MNGNRLRVIFFVTSVFGVVACDGCAQMAVNKALKQYKDQLDPSIGRMTKDDYIRTWGPPESTTAVSTGEVCVWRISYGSRMLGTASQHSLYSSTYQFQQQSSHEMYDKITMTFNKNGVLQQYAVWCQR